MYVTAVMKSLDYLGYFVSPELLLRVCRIFFSPLSQVGIFVDRETLLGFFSFGNHHCYNIETLINDGNNCSEDKPIISCLFSERELL